MDEHGRGACIWCRVLSVVFLHGLESSLDPNGFPIGRKARYLREHFDAVTPALDTSEAPAIAARCDLADMPFRYPFSGYEEAFATPLARAREAISPTARLIVGSSFGGAVALRLLHEAPYWQGAVLLLAGAGPKLTPYSTLPAGVRIVLVHGKKDTAVPFEESVALAATSATAELIAVDDGHRLASVVDNGWLGELVRGMLASQEAS
jgi:predicted esterase